MLRDIINLKGTKELNKEAQNFIRGGNGFISCRNSASCPPMFPICTEAGFCEREDC